MEFFGIYTDVAMFNTALPYQFAFVQDAYTYSHMFSSGWSSFMTTVLMFQKVSEFYFCSVLKGPFFSYNGAKWYSFNAIKA